MKYNDIIHRALEILQRDTELTNIVREFRLGTIASDTAEQYPAIHVIMDRPYQSGDNIGTFGTVDLQSSVNLQIKVMVSNSEVGVSSQQINRILDDVIMTLKVNPTFSESDGTDPLFKRSVVRSAEVSPATFGKTKQIGYVNMYAQSGSSYTLTIAGVAYDVITKPSGRTTEGLQPHFDTEMLLGGYAELGISEQKMYELEYTQDLDNALKAMMAAREIVSITETRNGTPDTFKANLANYAISVSNPDGLETISVMFVK